MKYKHPIDPQMSEICRRMKVSDYLRKRGVDLMKSGNKLRCICPIPGHVEKDGSFYISTMPDGTELWHCFGACGKGGNIITLVALIEGEKTKDVAHRLSKETGVELGKWDPMTLIDPINTDVLASFCEEDEAAMEISTWGLSFLTSQGGNEDAVNKISRIYEMVDDLSASGQGETVKSRWGVSKMGEVRAMLKKLVAQRGPG